MQSPSHDQMASTSPDGEPLHGISFSEAQYYTWMWDTSLPNEERGKKTGTVC